MYLLHTERPIVYLEECKNCLRHTIDLSTW